MAKQLQMEPKQYYKAQTVGLCFWHNFKIPVYLNAL